MSGIKFRRLYVNAAFNLIYYQFLRRLLKAPSIPKEGGGGEGVGEMKGEGKGEWKGEGKGEGNRTKPSSLVIMYLYYT